MTYEEIVWIFLTVFFLHNTFKYILSMGHEGVDSDQGGEKNADK